MFLFFKLEPSNFSLSVLCVSSVLTTFLCVHILWKFGALSCGRQQGCHNYVNDMVVTAYLSSMYIRISSWQDVHLHLCLHLLELLLCTKDLVCFSSLVFELGRVWKGLTFREASALFLILWQIQYLIQTWCTLHRLRDSKTVELQGCTWHSCVENELLLGAKLYQLWKWCLLDNECGSLLLPLPVSEVIIAEPLWASSGCKLSIWLERFFGSLSGEKRLKMWISRML